MKHPSNKIEDLGDLKVILSSRIFRQKLNERKAHLQAKVNEHVRAQQWTEAYGAVCRLDDIDKLWTRIQEWYKELTKEEK